MASRGGSNPPKISGTTKGMTMQFLPCNFDITGPVCKLQTKIPKIPNFGNATSRHANFTKFCRIVHIDVRNDP